MDKIIYQTVKLDCSPDKAFDMFTVNKHLENWLTNLASVEPKVGGKYELFWNPQDKANDSTIGCRILALQTNKLIDFEWRGAKQFKHFMNNVRPLTNVVVFFTSNKKRTEIHLVHTGWRDAPEWEEARIWFERAWRNAFAELKKYVEENERSV